MFGSIQPTYTHQVRTFLHHQGVDLKPWSGLDETYAQLYALLNRRRNDPSFWPPLRELLREIVVSSTDATRSRRLPAAQAELLASWDIDDLIDKLRAALPGGDQPADPSAARRFASKLSAAVMGGFLLLGATAAGCSSDDDSDKTPTDSRVDTVRAEAAPDEAAADSSFDTASAVDLGPWEANCDLNSSSVLWKSIDESGLPHQEKRALCECFATLNSSWSEGLTDLFANGTTQQIAATLAAMINCCDADNKANLDSNYPDKKDALIDGTLCNNVPIYKGVSFPK